MFLGTCIYRETFPFGKQKKLFCSVGAENKRKFNKASIACYTILAARERIEKQMGWLVSNGTLCV
jgi:hypothetical protein